MTTASEIQKALLSRQRCKLSRRAPHPSPLPTSGPANLANRAGAHLVPFLPLLPFLPTYLSSSLFRYFGTPGTSSSSDFIDDAPTSLVAIVCSRNGPQKLLPQQASRGYWSSGTYRRWCGFFVWRKQCSASGTNNTSACSYSSWNVVTDLSAHSNVKRAAE